MFTLAHRERGRLVVIVRPCRVAAQAHSAVGRVTGREGVAEASVRVDRIHAAPRALGVGAARHLPRVKGGEIGGFEGEPADSSSWGSGGAPRGPPLRRGHFDRAAARPSPRRARQRGSSRGASIARVAARRRGSAGAVPRPAAFRGMGMVRRCGMVRRRGMARGGAACRSSRRSRSTAASASISASCPRSAPGEVKGEGKGSR